MHVDFTHKQIGTGSDRLVTIIAGYTGKIDHFSTAANALQRQGYDVLMYEYSPSVFESGNPEALPTLIRDIGKDFTQRSKGYSYVQHSGPSLGGGIGWNLQKLDDNRLLPGVFVAAGTNAARLIFRNPIFRKSKAAFVKNGITESVLHAAYAEVLEPPKSPFVLALGSFDFIIPIREITAKINDFTLSSKVDVKVIIRRGTGHAGMIKWYNKNISHLLEEAELLRKDTTQPLPTQT